MGLTIRGVLPDGTINTFTLPDTGPTSTVEGWLQVVGPAGYQFLDVVGQGPSVQAGNVVIPSAAPASVPADSEAIPAGSGPFVDNVVPFSSYVDYSTEAPAAAEASLAPDNTWLWWAVGIAGLIWLAGRK